MREIEFRGKRKDNGQYVYGSYMRLCSGEYIYEERHPLTKIRSRAHIKRVAAIKYNELEN